MRISSRSYRALALTSWVTLAGIAQLHAAALSVNLVPSLPAPVPVGKVVTWTAQVSGSTSAVWYRFRSARAGWDLQVVRDFSPSNTLDWAASESEGVYEVEVTARDNTTGESAVASAAYEVIPAAAGSTPVITGTVNPLVFLYSAPACPAFATMRVEMVSPEGIVQSTPNRSCQPPCPASAAGSPALRRAPCGPPLSMNFYLAGLRPNATYSIQHVITSSDPRSKTQVERGPALTLVTPNVAPAIPKLAVKQAPSAPAGLILHSSLYTVSYATDLAGNLVWYYPAVVTFLTQTEPDGLFISLISPTYATSQSYDPSQEIFREFDLAGNTLRETNAARLNEQLAPLGKRIGALHHDARALPGGTVAILASTEQKLTNVQGTGTADVIGDMILVLDHNLQLKWVWDAFDHLDTRRMATLKEVCPAPGGGCPPLYLASKANDWLHGNAIQFLADGNLLYSSRHQDWVYKIDYANGAGSGGVIWKMGPGGDFQIQSTDPSPWFSHQHDPQFTAGGDATLTVFDDGNLRVAGNSSAHSRGQALTVDETNRVATLAVNADLGGFSFALGSAQQLAAGGYAFGAGWYIPANTSQVVQVDASGNTGYSLSVSDPEYRTYRMSDLYTP